MTPSTLTRHALTLEYAAAMLREAMRDRSFEETTLGGQVMDYLRAKRKRLTRASYEDYESTLAKMCWHLHGLELSDLDELMLAVRGLRYQRQERARNPLVETVGIEPTPAASRVGKPKTRKRGDA